jgi:AAA family ATP:ADP antiporter
MSADQTSPARAGSALDRALRVFGDVRAGEGRDVVLLLANVFLLLSGYYILKVVREPLILATGGAELKSYAAAAQAVALMAVVPACSRLASRVDRLRLTVWILVINLACVTAFVAAGIAQVPNLGFIFYVWLGIFVSMTVAQFWSFANDLYSKADGERLFPLIGIGSTAGAPVGAWLAAQLFGTGASPFLLMGIAGVVILAHLALYLPLARGRGTRTSQATGALGGANGFALVLGKPYLRNIMVLLVVLNLVNTVGEYVLSRTVLSIAEHREALHLIADKESFIGSAYGRFNVLVSVVSLVLQALVASRLVKHFGLAGVLFPLPLIALGGYGLIAAGGAAMVVAYTKLAENSADYSLMNTAKQMLWLPTTRDEKYKAKQAIDTFFVRFGDLCAAALVFGGTAVGLTIQGFAAVNIGLVLVWLVIAWRLLGRYQAADPHH